MQHFDNAKEQNCCVQCSRSLGNCLIRRVSSLWHTSDMPAVFHVKSNRARKYYSPDRSTRVGCAFADQEAGLIVHVYQSATMQLSSVDEFHEQMWFVVLFVVVEIGSV
ncbi:hypothetical protein R1flu_028366 [Riccia fluitans]|uniref:Uncharacterized protein n=1 Tax=Riccia fluitans TaxID=41844 RepID=A0ABD1XQH8_9MARC